MAEKQVRIPLKAKRIIQISDNTKQETDLDPKDRFDPYSGKEIV